MLARLNRRLRGYRVYALAMVAALPDILNGLAGVDLSELLPFGWGTKAATALVVLRIVATAMAAQAAVKPVDEPR